MPAVPNIFPNSRVFSAKASGNFKGKKNISLTLELLSFGAISKMEGQNLQALACSGLLQSKSVAIDLGDWDSIFEGRRG